MAIPCTSPTPQTPPRVTAHWAKWAAVLIAITLITFNQLIRCDFTNWDDIYTVAKDPGINPPTWHALAHHWTHADMDIYMPVTQTVWAAIACVARTPSPDTGGISLNPSFFHLGNLLVHLMAVLIVFSLLQAMGFAPLPAAFGAALFALHPVQVEPVAWISGLKDLLCGLLGLAALRLWLAPISRVDRPMARSITAAVFALLAMLSKPSGITLPLLAGALAILHRPNRRQIVQLIPWVILSAIFAAIARLSQSAGNVPHPPLLDRPFIAADTLWFYLRKITWPTSLCIDYGRTPQAILSQGSMWLWVELVSILMLIGVLYVIRSRCRTGNSVGSAILAGTALFLAGILPVMGLVCFDFQEYSTTADHYLYLALLGPAVVLASLLHNHPNRPLRIVAIAWLSLLSLRSFTQCPVWQSAITLNRHAIEVNPTSWVSHLNLSDALLWVSPGQAVEQARIASRLRPQNPRGWSALAQAADTAGDFNLAIFAYRQLLLYNPTNTPALCNLAALLAEHGQKAEAIRLYQKALSQSPNLPAAKAGLVKLNSHNAHE